MRGCPRGEMAPPDLRLERSSSFVLPFLSALRRPAPTDPSNTRLPLPSVVAAGPPLPPKTFLTPPPAGRPARCMVRSCGVGRARPTHLSGMAGSRCAAGRSQGGLLGAMGCEERACRGTSRVGAGQGTRSGGQDGSGAEGTRKTRLWAGLQKVAIWRKWNGQGQAGRGGRGTGCRESRWEGGGGFGSAWETCQTVDWAPPQASALMPR